MASNPSIVFMGTPEFAVPSLDKLHSTYGVSCVVTVPDKAKGRGRHLSPPEVKKRAIELKIPVLQPESLKSEDFEKELSSFNPDIIVVIAFRILPPKIYKMSRLASFNVHGSLLPKYRGAAPINWAIINGETETGLTTFLLQEQVDTGQILLRKKVEIKYGATAGDLHDLLMPLAADLAYETCELIIRGDYTAEIQNNSEASPAPKIFPEQCRINWNDNSLKLKNFIHGVSPIPGAWTVWGSSRLKIYRVGICSDLSLKVAEYLITKNAFYVGCVDGTLEIKELQTEGRKMMSIGSFLNGFKGEKRGLFD